MASRVGLVTHLSGKMWRPKASSSSSSATAGPGVRADGDSSKEVPKPKNASSPEGSGATGNRKVSKVKGGLEQSAYRDRRAKHLLMGAGVRARGEANLEGYTYRNRHANLSLIDAAQHHKHCGNQSNDVVPEAAGLVIFFPGMPGCAKSILCEEILNSPTCLGDNRPIYFTVGDLAEETYWQIVAEELKKNPARILLTDINAPNEVVWMQIEEMCRTTHTAAVPVVSDSEGTSSNPYCIEALAVFMFRALGHSLGNLDVASCDIGYVLLRFYHLYEGNSRRKFEMELYRRFGSLVKMPLLKPDRAPLPDVVKHVLEEGIGLFRLHQNKHRSVTPSEGAYAQDWSQWMEKLDVILVENADHLNSIQVPLDLSMKEVMDQLKPVATGDKGNFPFDPPTTVFGVLDLY